MAKRRPLAASFFRHLSAERGLAGNTCKSYAGDVSAWLAWLEGRRADPLSAGAEAVEAYLWRLKSELGLKASSIFRKTEAIRSFYRFLLLEGRIKKDPTVNFRSPRIERRIPPSVSREDMERLLDYPPGEDFALNRALAAAELLYACGLRVSELLSLRLESVNLDQGWARVFGKGGKERIVPVHARALDALRSYMELRQLRFGGMSPAGELFLNKSGGKLSRVQMWKDLLALGRKAGVEVPLHPHLLRHTFASHLLQSGADLRSIQELLGHASLNTTQIYTHVERSALKKAHKRFHPEG